MTSTYGLVRSGYGRGPYREQPPGAIPALSPATRQFQEGAILMPDLDGDGFTNDAEYATRRDGRGRMLAWLWAHSQLLRPQTWILSSELRSAGAHGAVGTPDQRGSGPISWLDLKRRRRRPWRMARSS